MTKLFDLLQRCYSVDGRFLPKFPHSYVRYSVRQIKWSAGETAFLKMCVAKRFSRRQIARHFPDRSLLAIKAKIERERRQYR
jgi:hypothetical protein